MQFKYEAEIGKQKERNLEKRKKNVREKPNGVQVMDSFLRNKISWWDSVSVPETGRECNDSETVNVDHVDPDLIESIWALIRSYSGLFSGLVTKLSQAFAVSYFH